MITNQFPNILYGEVNGSLVPVGTLTVTNGGQLVLNVQGGGGGDSYVLPPATDSTLGGVKVGSGLAVTGDGTLSASSGGVESVVAGTGISVDSTDPVNPIVSSAFDPTTIKQIYNISGSFATADGGAQQLSSPATGNVTVDWTNRTLFSADGSSTDGILYQDSLSAGSWTGGVDDSTTPTNAVTPAGWIKITLGGTPSWIPYYR